MNIINHKSEMLKKIDEFVDTLDGAIRPIKGDEPECGPNKVSMSNKTSDQASDMITSPATSNYNWGLGYFSGPILENETIKEVVLDKNTYSAFDLLNVDEAAPGPEDVDSENTEFLDKTKYFIEVFNDYFSGEEKVVALNYIFKSLNLDDIDGKYKNSLLKSFKNSLQ